MSHTAALTELFIRHGARPGISTLCQRYTPLMLGCWTSPPACQELTFNPSAQQTRGLSSSRDGPKAEQPDPASGHPAEPAQQPQQAHRPSMAAFAAALQQQLSATHQQRGSSGPDTTSSSPGPSPSVASLPSAAQPDLFTQSLQRKTEQQLLDLMERQREAALMAEQLRAKHPHLFQQQQDGTNTQAEGPSTAEAGAAEDDNDDGSRALRYNPETGEYGGPKGREPTRFGDWAFNGRVTDF